MATVNELMKALVRRHTTADALGTLVTELPEVLGDQVDADQHGRDLLRLQKVALFALNAINGYGITDPANQHRIDIAIKAIARLVWVAGDEIELSSDPEAFAGIEYNEDGMPEVVNERQPIFEYTVTHKLPNGGIEKTNLVGCDNEHAHEEATYECEGEILKVERGEQVGFND